MWIVCLFVCVCVLYGYNSTANRTSKHHPQPVVVAVADFQSSRFQLANIAGGREREGKGEREWGGVEVDETTKSD